VKAQRKRFIGDQAFLITGLGLGFTLTVQITTLTAGDFADPYAIITTISRFFALTGSYLSIIGLLLIARIPWIENALGHDRLVVWHRKAMPYALYMITLHVLLVGLGYAGAEGKVIANELWIMTTTYPWMLPAAAGFLLLILAGITSYKNVRNSIKYETWWVIHLYTYLGVALSFMHQILTGGMFIGHPLNRAYWIGLYLSVVFSIVTWRIIIPIARSIRHQLVISKVEVEGPDVVSIYVSGRNISKLNAQGGQFFNWRFLTKDRWHESHPFSLSAAPTDSELRFTVKALGDSTNNFAQVKVGTRVVIEGPYGIFTRDMARQFKHATLIGGGVGITPLRAIIDEIPDSTSIDVIYRARNHDDLVLKSELDELAQRRNVNIHYLVGSRTEHPINEVSLKKYVPRFADSDVYVCGPQGLIDDVVSACKSAGIPKDRVHHEAFLYHAQ
jgi:predicted ferric reductase